MQTQSVIDRICSYGLFQAQTNRRSDGSRYIIFEDDSGKRYMIDHPDDFPPVKRLPLLNRFLKHYGLSVH